MTAAKFESSILKLVAPFLKYGGRAEFDNGTLFVEGIMPEDAQDIMKSMKRRKIRARMQISGSYQTDFYVSYDFVA